MQVRWIPGESFWANSYICGSILIDAGILPLAIERYHTEIDTIILTHCHYDHIAHLPEIAHMCDAEIYIHIADAPGLNDAARSLSMFFGARLPPIGPAMTLTEGDRMGGLQVIHTPGHTPGSICLYNEDEHALISGDTVFTDGGFGRFDFPGGSLDQLRESIQRLSKLEIRSLYPGHGEPATTGGNRHIESALHILTNAYE